MPKDLIGLSVLSHPNFLTTTESMLVNLENHPDTPKEVPKPYPSLFDLRAGHNFYKELYHAAENGDRVKRDQRNRARKVTENDFNNYGHFLVTSGVSHDFLMEVGYSVAHLSGKKSVHLDPSEIAPKNFKVSHSKVSGKYWISCSRTEGVAVYDLWYAKDPSSEASWSHFDFYTHCKTMEAPGFEPGSKTYFRLRNIGAHGPGPWTEVVSLICL